MSITATELKSNLSKYLLLAATEDIFITHNGRTVAKLTSSFEISGDIPNAETVEALQEVKRMKADHSLGKTYTDVDKMMKELLKE